MPTSAEQGQIKSRLSLSKGQLLFSSSQLCGEWPPNVPRAFHFFKETSNSCFYIESLFFQILATFFKESKYDAIKPTDHVGRLEIQQSIVFALRPLIWPGESQPQQLTIHSALLTVIPPQNFRDKWTHKHDCKKNCFKPSSSVGKRSSVSFAYCKPDQIYSSYSRPQEQQSIKLSSERGKKGIRQTPITQLNFVLGIYLQWLQASSKRKLIRSSL